MVSAEVVVGDATAVVLVPDGEPTNLTLLTRRWVLGVPSRTVHPLGFRGRFNRVHERVGEPVAASFHGLAGRAL